MERNVNGQGTTGISRRQFFKSSSMLAGAALFASTGASGAFAEETADEVAAAQNGTTISYTVYDTDVLVIGTGFSGYHAALTACAKGAKVIMVDKGPYGFSGGCGMNWDQEVFWPNAAPETYATSQINSFMSDQKLIKNSWEFIGQNDEAWNTPLRWVRQGNTTWNRLEDGSFENLMMAGAPINMAQGGFSRHIHDTVKSQPITIVDNTMITNIFVSDGVCVGAIGYHVHTGEYRVFRAKATVGASGPCCQMVGWLDVHPISMNTPDNTGELQAAAYRHGVPLIDNEFLNYDLISVSPTSLGASFNGGIGADGNHMLYVVDADGNYFMRETAQYDVSRRIRDRVIEGKGGAHGGVWIDLTSEESRESTKLRPVYGRNVQMWKEKFGIDVTEEGYRIPVALEAFEHGQGFLIDEHCSTCIPGLYGVRGYGRCGYGLDAVSYIGAYAGNCAAEYAAASTGGTVDWADAEAELARLDEIRTREVADGIRPMELRHKIQKTFYENWEPATNAEKLETAIAEIERIKAEDLPRQCTADKSPAYNLDWKNAVENYSIIDSTEATLRAALVREESRGTFYRSDFPDQDNENWALNILVTLKDGEMALEKSAQVMA